MLGARPTFSPAAEGSLDQGKDSTTASASIRSTLIILGNLGNLRNLRNLRNLSTGQMDRQTDEDS